MIEMVNYKRDFFLILLFSAEVVLQKEKLLLSRVRDVIMIKIPIHQHLDFIELFFYI